MAFPEISVAELSDRLAAGEPLFDVRQPDEYRDGHAPGAVLVPLGEVPDRLAEFPTGTRVQIICRSGGRSANACAFLTEHGVDAVNVAGGTLAWIDAGYEVVTGESPR